MSVTTKGITAALTHPRVKRAARSLRDAGIAGPALVVLGGVSQLGAILIPGVFAAGAVFGAAAALVMTPRAREAVRRDVRELLEELRAAREQREREDASAGSHRRD